MSFLSAHVPILTSSHLHSSTSSHIPIFRSSQPRSFIYSPISLYVYAITHSFLETSSIISLSVVHAMRYSYTLQHSYLRSRGRHSTSIPFWLHWTWRLVGWKEEQAEMYSKAASSESNSMRLNLLGPWVCVCVCVWKGCKKPAMSRHVSHQTSGPCSFEESNKSHGMV